MSTPSDKAKSLDEILAEMQAVADKASASWSNVDMYICGGNISAEEVQNFIAQSRTAMPRLIEAINYLLPKYVDLAFAHDDFTIEESHEAINSVKSHMSEILQGRA